MCSAIDTFGNNWSIENTKKVMLLGFVCFDDIEKLRGCYLITKEDPSVFVTPAVEATKKSKKTQRQWMIDEDYTGFAFAPAKWMDPYKEDQEKYPRLECPIPFPDGKSNDEILEMMDSKRRPRPTKLKNIKTSWPKARDRGNAAELFKRMTNFVAAHFGWHTGGDLVPTAHLDVEISKDQVDMLNPTPRDVQIGAIIDQCSGKKATKVIARRRVDFVAGNINSYARILNGPAQLEKIRDFNQMAASVSVLRRERIDKAEKTRERKKKEDVGKAEKKLEKEREDQEKRQEAEAHVEKGFDHVMSLTLPFKLKY